MGTSSKDLMANAPDYLNPDVPRGLKRVLLPVVDATDENLAGYGSMRDGARSWSSRASAGSPA